MITIPDKLSEVMKFPKSYLINIIYTIMNEKFSTWVDAQIQERNQKVAEAGKMLISMDPDVAKAFMGSTAVSLCVI